MLNYKILQDISGAFQNELNLAQSNLKKAKKSKSLNFPGFIEPNETVFNFYEKTYEFYIKSLFYEDIEDEKEILEEAITWLTEAYKDLVKFNRFCSEARDAGDLQENKLQRLIKEVLQEDRCKKIADRKYDKPSAYKSGAIVRCRKGNIWKDLKEIDNLQSGKEKKTLNIQDLAYKQIPGLLEKGIKNELKFLSNKMRKSFEDIKNITKPQIKRVPLYSIEPSQYGEDYENPSSKYEVEEFEKILNGKKDIKNHREEDFNPILADKNTNKIIDGNHRHYALSTIGSPYAVVLFVDVPKEYLNEAKKETLRTWFKRKGAPGKEGGWVDCNAPIRKDGKITGYKTCGRKEGEKRAKYPSCRPTAAQCKTPGKGTKWGKTK
jgi:hypothetical protein